MAFGGNTSPHTAAGAPVPSQWQHGGLTMAFRWHCWLLMSGCFSLPQSLQFCLPSLCTHHPAFLPLLPLLHLLAHLSGEQGLWVSGVISGVPCLTCSACVETALS